MAAGANRRHPADPVGVTELEDRIREVKGPRPILSHKRERALTTRQRQLLDDLTAVFDDGFHHLTMADLAAQLGCSLRTLYGLAPSRDELVLMVADRNLWSVGRSAMNAIDPESSPLAALRSYLRAATVAVAGMTEAFAHDCEAVPETRALNDAHSNYLIAVSRAILELAMERGDIAEVDGAAVARVAAGLGRDFSRPEVMPTLRTSPKEAADAVLDIILAGLRPPPQRGDTTS